MTSASTTEKVHPGSVKHNSLPRITVGCNRFSAEAAAELLTVSITKSKPHLGIAIEGGANTRHPLPRIINIDAAGAAFDAAGLKVGQTIIEVNGTLMEGLQHDEAARCIAEAFADRASPELQITVTANSFRPHADLYRPNS